MSFAQYVIKYEMYWFLFENILIFNLVEILSMNCPADQLLPFLFCFLSFLLLLVQDLQSLCNILSKVPYSSYLFIRNSVVMFFYCNGDIISNWNRRFIGRRAIFHDITNLIQWEQNTFLGKWAA
jgi:hypothetical protein